MEGWEDQARKEEQTKANQGCSTELIKLGTTVESILSGAMQNTPLNCPPEEWKRGVFLHQLVSASKLVPRSVSSLTICRYATCVRMGRDFPQRSLAAVTGKTRGKTTPGAAQARCSQVTPVCSRLSQQSSNKKVGWEAVRSATGAV